MSKTLLTKEAKPLLLGKGGVTTGLIIPQPWVEILQLRKEPYAIMHLQENKYGHAIHIYKPKITTKEETK